MPPRLMAAGGDTLPPSPCGYCAGTFPEGHRDGVGGYYVLRDIVEATATQGGAPRTADFDDSCRRNNRWRLDAASVSGATPTEKQFVFRAKNCQNAQIN